MTTITLVSENMDKVRFNITLKNKLAIVLYILRTHMENVKIKKAKRVSENTEYTIDLDESPETIMLSIDIILKSNPIVKYTDFTQYTSLFGYFNGTSRRWPASLAHVIAVGMFHYLSVIDVDDVFDYLSYKNIDKYVLGQYLKYLFCLRINKTRSDKVIEIIEHEGGDELAYFKAVCKKHRIAYNVKEFIKNKGMVEVLLRITGDHDNNEYSRNVVVRLANILELGRLYKSIPEEYIESHLVKDALDNKLIYSIYKNTYFNDDFEYETNILVNWISDRSEESKKKISNIKKLAKHRYPEYIIFHTPQWIDLK